MDLPFSIVSSRVLPGYGSTRLAVSELPLFPTVASGSEHLIFSLSLIYNEIKLR
jgi:hypothetical protein